MIQFSVSSVIVKHSIIILQILWILIVTLCNTLLMIVFFIFARYLMIKDDYALTDSFSNVISQSSMMSLSIQTISILFFKCSYFKTIQKWRVILQSFITFSVVEQTDWWLWLILFIWFSRLDKYLCDCKGWALCFSHTHIQHHHVYTVQLIWQFRIRFFLSAWYDSTVLDRIHALFLESLSPISTLLCVYCQKSRNKTKSHSYNNWQSWGDSYIIDGQAESGCLNWLWKTRA